MAIVFDAAQKKAVYADERPLLVLAGPGSGKTTVLVHRIAYLTQQKKIKPEEILVLTFTRASAGEMKQRFLKLTGANSTGVTFGTFHSVFYAFLRQNGYLGFQVIDQETEIQLTREAITETLGLCIISNKTTQAVLDAIGRLKNGMSVNDDLSLKVYPLLRSKMQRIDAIDFDDMLLLLYRLLVGDPELVKTLRSRYRYILVDEFQDINRTQYEIIKILAHPDDRIFAVGDDDQAIYGFRGSNPGYMREFLKDFLHSHSVVLTANHRSVGRIVSASKRLIGHNKNRFSKRLVSTSERGNAPVFHCFDTLEDEMDYVQQKSSFFLTEGKGTSAKSEVPLSIAVLARTTKALDDGKKLLPPELRDRICWMTFHGSKGLEFDVVFIISAEEGITPDRRNLDGEAMEEERRCFYVAVTRCKKYLHILYTKDHYNKAVERSRFVSEMKLFWW